MKYIAVFCSANDLEKKYKKSAKQFAKLIVENNFNLVSIIKVSTLEVKVSTLEVECY